MGSVYYYYERKDKMKDSQKKYLDKVVDIIVRDTIIDYGKGGKVEFPFYHRPLPHRLPPYILPFPYFSKYCKNTYGIVGDEIEYVWDQYMGIIKDKIRNGR
jgi:hypothetical protein